MSQTAALTKLKASVQEHTTSTRDFSCS